MIAAISIPFLQGCREFVFHLLFFSNDGPGALRFGREKSARGRDGAATGIWRSIASIAAVLCLSMGRKAILGLAVTGVTLLCINLTACRHAADFLTRHADQSAHDAGNAPVLLGTPATFKASAVLLRARNWARQRWPCGSPGSPASAPFASG